MTHTYFSVYSTLVKQQIVNSITNLVIYLLAIIAIYSLFKFLINNETDIEEYEFLLAMIIAISIVFLFYLFATISDTITGFINPEYGAIQDVIELMHPK